MDFNTVYTKYRDRLDEVEYILHSRSEASNGDLMKASSQLLDAGGKRLRPLFALICGTLVEADAQAQYNVAKISAALELTHMATLVHDDVIDGAALRRGRPTVRSEYGNLAAMYTGDFLFARAMQLLAEVGDVEVNIRMSQGLVRVCKGEIEQIRDFYNWDQSIRTYLRRIERKTALLIALSCSFGAKVIGAAESDVRRLRLFGHYTGMAFQMIDDVLDFTGSEQVVGKPVGGDLRQGNITLPALFAAQDKRVHDQLRKLVYEGAPDASVEEAMRLIISTEALAQTKALVSRYLDKALTTLQGVSDSGIQRELAILTNFVSNRAF